MIFNTVGGGISGGGGYIPPLGESDFTYTGEYTLIDDGDSNWRLKFLTSGIFTPLRDLVVDVFLVGGGGAGGTVDGGSSAKAGGGGGGGYTISSSSQVLLKGVEYPVVIGAGGAEGAKAYAWGVSGGQSSFNGITANGGHGGAGGSLSLAPGQGGMGGSGGGASPINNNSINKSGSGGSDGGDGGGNNDVLGGTGQGTTTREFGEADKEQYAGGGGSGSLGPGQVAGSGGSDGGTGGNSNYLPTQPSVGGISPQRFSCGGGGGGYGGGGGGSGGYSTWYGNGGAGCQGIVIIRNHQEA